MICRVAFKVILGAGAEDVRSDDEGEGESVEEEEETEVVRSPVEVGEKKEVRKRK